MKYYVTYQYTEHNNPWGWGFGYTVFVNVLESITYDTIEHWGSLIKEGNTKIETVIITNWKRID